MKLTDKLFNPAKKAYDSWAPFILRVIVGLGFLIHGQAKLSKGPAGFMALLQHLGIPQPKIMAWIAICTEVLGGIALITGAFVSIVSVPLIITMLTAMFTIHYKFGYSSIKTIGLDANGPKFGPPGYEINLLYIAALGMLIAVGGGRFSLDSLFAKKRKV
ncbi:putative oxidoreductase [Chitinophaga terrae (ex Kim and Jung 2007)]|uniref:Putative oxidoreductase n=1 Tax=Chitinophaga terrae (ex Kim and Jung 2007) TaxID=408074 RepID=A0A1H4FF23_9BACT|nr:DoxX family protein [Chitinophaga terrae (ex Kim and Jung 2007)]GEP92370.1 membrane protein [Chitinophaga terrae (ex Kim and Jung 2007)]SEA95953.1 putative oxidoreductase [Chitinophaga terrae (ex Kim and Jung 2007)]